MRIETRRQRAFRAHAYMVHIMAKQKPTYFTCDSSLALRKQRPPPPLPSLPAHSTLNTRKKILTTHTPIRALYTSSTQFFKTIRLPTHTCQPAGSSEMVEKQIHANNCSCLLATRNNRESSVSHLLVPLSLEQAQTAGHKSK